MVEGHPQRVQNLAIQAPGEPAGRPLEGAIEVERDSGRRLRGPLDDAVVQGDGDHGDPLLCGPANKPGSVRACGQAPYEPPVGAGHREDTARIGSVTSTRPRDAQVLSCRPGSQVQSGSVVAEGAGRLPVVAPESRDEGRSEERRVGKECRARWWRGTSE